MRAAHNLFVGRGYSATTIADIAAAAEVSSPTVYAAFQSKAALLKSCIDIALAGDEEAVAVRHRPLAAWVYDTGDARELVARYAEMMGRLARRAAPIYDVLVRAADRERELADLLGDLEQQRLRAATMVAEAIAERGGLPAGRTVREARDTIWICNAPELYVTLTRRRRWSTRRYVDWSRNALIQLVIEPPTTVTAQNGPPTR